MSEEDKQLFNKMIYCNLINGEQALKFKRKYENLQQKVEEKDKEIERLNNIINYIWQVFENGGFEDGCDCIKIYDYLKELKENKVNMSEEYGLKFVVNGEDYDKIKKSLNEQIEDLKQELNELDEEYVKLYEKYCNLRNEKKDLQQKVEQLEKENKELNRMCELYGQSLYNADLTKAEKRVEQLENIRKEAIKATKDVKQFVYDELVDRNVSGATETHCKIMDLLNILNKGSEE